MRSCATLASGACAGTKMYAFNPRLAANPAHDEAAFPVDEQVMVSKPSSTALVAPTHELRSLKLPVGRRPSSFTKKLAMPQRLATLGNSIMGVQPHCSVGSR